MTALYDNRWDYKTA